MSDPQVLEVLAHAFVQEGTKVHFTLMGDANMFWSDCMARKFGVCTIHVMHEHSAVVMADAYARYTGEVGVVTQLNPRYPLRPIVSVNQGEGGPGAVKFVDLSTTTLVHITEVVGSEIR